MNCYVLAGGMSRRMGEPKERLELGGRSFLERVVDAASEAFANVIVVAKGGALLPQHLPAIRDSDEKVAPICGVARALEEGEARCWILAVDYPLITSRALGELRRRFEDSGSDLLVPYAGGFLHMLCAGYSQSLLPTLKDKIDRGELALHPLVGACRSVVVSANDIPDLTSALVNVNERADYERLRETHERRN